MLKSLKDSHYIEKAFIVLFGLYFFSLPIAGITAIQNIFLGLFILLFFIYNYNKINYKGIFYYKELLIILGVIIVLALISLFFTPELKESLKEIRSELIKNILFMFIFFYFTINYFHVIKKYLIYVLAFIFLIHSLINIYMMIDAGGFGFRGGGLLDNGGGERFGIWATYSFAFSIALLFTRFKKLALFFLIISVVSIFANHTRATYLTLLLQVFIFLLYFYKNKIIKTILFLVVIILPIIIYLNSDSLNKRYDVQSVFNNIENFIVYSPSEYGKLETEVDTGITARLSMWKSVIVYRLEEPFIPQGYGRFLYGKGIQENFKTEPENIPYMLFSQAHNDYISILYGLGVIGLIFFVTLFILKIRLAVKLNSNNDEFSQYFSVFIVFGTIGFMGSMMFGSFFGDSEAKFFYPLFGILLGSYFMTKEKSSEKVINET